MLRRLHSLPGVIAALLVAFMAVTGAVLALDPVLQQWRAGPAATDTISVAQVAAAVADNFAEPDRMVRTASGAVIVYHAQAGGRGADYIDPKTGASTGAYQPSAFFGFFTELHRSLFLGTGGRATAGIAAASLLVLSVSGVLLLVARLGGWRRLFSRARGTFGQRLHVELARVVVLGLLLSSISGAYMSLVSFEVLPDGTDGFAAFPVSDGGRPAPVAGLAGLVATPLEDLRELVFPAAGDETDVFTITTRSGQGFVDQATGEMLSFTPNGAAQTVYETFYMLHTGQGAAWLGLLLGFTALGVPAMAASGVVIWWQRRRGMPRIPRNVAPAAADTVILVGSEGNSTWGFAAALHGALTAAGHKVHAAPMNALSADFRRARRMLILAATYGDGTAPASANRFLARLDKLPGPPAFEYAVLGFGDRRFRHFCGYAAEVDAALAARGWAQVQPLESIDRQSSQGFAQWAAALGAHIGTPLAVNYAPPRPRTTTLTLSGRVDYGWEVQAPTAVLRFSLPDMPRGGLGRWFGRRRGLAKFEAGDLVGILPPGSDVPRYYSLASGAREGFLEICVRKQQGGLCSEFLHALAPGDTIEAFVRPNPEFRPGRGREPVIMIGAGTGIAPLVGFAWANLRRRPMHLYWGGRDPGSDHLYEDNLAQCVDDGRLTRVVTAFSRVGDGAYVQERVRDDAEAIRALVLQGARVMVCGGREMAEGVMAAIDASLAPLGINVGALRAAGRYLEDVY
ncbi:PepSY domain-containing protein [Devosia sp.]|uniref:PepSY domain-containing protein n=1 Tax=Devosia sp. TaxID=1871048 RepID=UPI002EFD3C08